MKRYRKILIALTGSPADRAALEWARLVADLAHPDRAEVLILDPEPAAWVPEFPPLRNHEVWEDRVRAATEEVDEVFRGLPDLSLHTKACVGAPLPGILQELVDAASDLVVLGVADQDDRSLAEKLARKSPASVLTVPEAAASSCRSILTPVDFSAPSALALEVATAFGRALGTRKIRCLHSFRLPTRGNPAGLSQEQLLAAYEESGRNHLSEFLNSPAASIRGVDVDAVVRAGPTASEAVLDELQERPAELVVMATRGRSSIARALLGSNTAEIIRRAPVPVLAVKAKGEGLPVLRALLGNEEQAPTRPALAT